MSADVPVSRVLDHADYLLERLGEDGVAFGSDYDGAVVPAEIAGVERLSRLRQAMVYRGYGEMLIEKLCHRNWVDVLERTWGE